MSEKVQVSFRMRKPTHAKLKALAEREHRSMSQQMEHLVEQAAATLPPAQQLDLEERPEARRKQR